MRENCFIATADGTCIVNCQLDKSKCCFGSTHGVSSICNLAASLHQLTLLGKSRLMLEFRRAKLGPYVIYSLIGPAGNLNCTSTENESKVDFIVVLVDFVEEIVSSKQQQFSPKPYLEQVQHAKLFLLTVRQQFLSAHSDFLLSFLKKQQELNSENLNTYDFQTVTNRLQDGNNAMPTNFRRFQDLELKRMLRQYAKLDLNSCWDNCIAEIASHQQEVEGLEWVGWVISVNDASECFQTTVPSPNPRTGVAGKLESVLKGEMSRLLQATRAQGDVKCSFVGMPASTEHVAEPRDSETGFADLGEQDVKLGIAKLFQTKAEGSGQLLRMGGLTSLVEGRFRSSLDSLVTVVLLGCYHSTSSSPLESTPVDWAEEFPANIRTPQCLANIVYSQLPFKPIN